MKKRYALLIPAVPLIALSLLCTAATVEVIGVWESIRK